MLRKLLISIAAGLGSGALFLIMSSIMGSSIQSSTSAATTLAAVVAATTFALITFRGTR
ncbi:hypothetical protein [Aliiroseovarius sp. 2305UL8-7]|uniref:hypothetical protein n=1 Tax=Aliiroseovarius conchicola TaxID=3121637 RepID=UPI003529B8F6